jgi:hypothetical protein
MIMVRSVPRQVGEILIPNKICLLRNKCMPFLNNNTILASVMIFSAFVFWLEWVEESLRTVASRFTEMLRSSVRYHQCAGYSHRGPHHRCSFSIVLHRLTNLGDNL